VLVDKANRFPKDFAFRILFHPTIGDGLFTSVGDKWRRQRKLVAPKFQPQQVAAYARVMPGFAIRHCERWREGEEIDAHREVHRIALGITGKTMFDEDDFEGAHTLADALKAASAWVDAQGVNATLIARILALRFLSRFPPTPRKLAVDDFLFRPPRVPIGKNRPFLRAMRSITSRFDAMIAERRAMPGKRRDLLATLVEMRDDAGLPMSDRQILDEALTMFAAGTETTSNSVTWTLYMLTQHPEVRERVEYEVDRLGDRDPTYEDLPRLAYLLQVFKETLRLFPASAVLSREAGEGADLSGMPLPRHFMVFVSPYTIHRSPDLWPDPEKFDPTRFDPENERSRPRIAWIPFGAGPRTCIGNHFALMEAQLVLATILRRFRLDMRPGHEMKIAPFPTLHPLGGLPMIVKRRSKTALVAA
jgi:cytochrome P450